MNSELWEVKQLPWRPIFENTVKNYLIFSAILLIGLLFKGKLSSLIRKWIYKIVGDSKNPDGKVEFDNLLKKPISYFILLILLYFSFNWNNPVYSFVMSV